MTQMLQAANYMIVSNRHSLFETLCLYYNNQLVQFNSWFMIAIDNQSSTNKYALCCVLDRLVKE